MKTLTITSEQIYCALIVLLIFCPVMLAARPAPYLATGHGLIGKSQAATTATAPLARGTNPSVKTAVSAKNATAESRHRVRIHQCPGTDHFVFSAPEVLSVADRVKLLDHAVHDWTKINAGKFRVRAAVGFVSNGSTETVHVWADPIAPKKD